MKETMLTRHDTHVGEGTFDSVQWAFETHVKIPDDGTIECAVLFGNEDYPERIEFYTANDITKRALIWTPEGGLTNSQGWTIRTTGTGSGEEQIGAVQSTQARNYANGMTVLGKYNKTIFIRLPRAISVPCTGGCGCDYCKKHPELIPMWDTLAISDDGRGHTWTVHMPDVPYHLMTKRSQK